MTERLSLSTPAELEAALHDLREAIAWPATQDLSASVAARLAVAPAPDRRPWWRRSLPRALLLAAALTLLVAGLAIGIRFGLDLLSIQFGRGPSPSATAVASPSIRGQAWAPYLARASGSATPRHWRRSLAEAEFPVVVPAAARAARRRLSRRSQTPRSGVRSSTRPATICRPAGSSVARACS